MLLNKDELDKIIGFSNPEQDREFDTPNASRASGVFFISKNFFILPKARP